MITFPSFDPLATGAPLTSTLLVVGAPLLLAVAVVLGALALGLCIGALRARPRATRLGARARAGMPLAPAGRMS